MLERGELDFMLGREIGAEGRNSRVFEAIDKQLNAEIVVKQLPRSEFRDVDEFFQEAQRLYDARHLHVVPVKWACRASDYIYIAMPRYRGSIHRLLESHPLTVRQIVRYGLGFLSGLHHVHSRRLIHFDVKPSNVLLDASDRAALSDFGLSRHVDSGGLAEQGDMYLLHLPPESLEATHVTTAADIFQAGLTLYRMCSPLKPLEMQWARFAADIPRALNAGRLPDRTAAAYPAHIPSRLRTTIRKALAVDPDDRYATILEMINDLAAVDEWLDWRYQLDSGIERWTLQAPAHERNLELEASGSSFEVRAKSRNVETGTERVNRQLSGVERTRAAANGRIRQGLSRL